MGKWSDRLQKDILRLSGMAVLATVFLTAEALIQVDALVHRALDWLGGLASSESN